MLKAEELDTSEELEPLEDEGKDEDFDDEEEEEELEEELDEDVVELEPDNELEPDDELELGALNGCEW